MTDDYDEDAVANERDNVAKYNFDDDDDDDTIMNALIITMWSKSYENQRRLWF